MGNENRADLQSACSRMRLYPTRTWGYSNMSPSATSVYEHPIPQGSPRRGLLSITVGEAGLPDEPTEHECTAVRPQRGRISSSMWSIARARVYPTIGAVFCLHCLHRRRKCLKIFGLWVKANGKSREVERAYWWVW